MRHAVIPLAFLGGALFLVGALLLALWLVERKHQWRDESAKLRVRQCFWMGAALILTGVGVVGSVLTVFAGSPFHGMIGEPIQTMMGYTYVTVTFVGLVLLVWAIRLDTKAGRSEYDDPPAPTR